MTEVYEIIEKISPHYQKRAKLKEQGLVDSIPETEHTLVYDSSTDLLEGVYFFLLDLVEQFGFKVEKLSDNFTASPTSSSWQEIGQRKGIVQQQAIQIL